MTNKANDNSESELSYRTDGGTAVTGLEETQTDTVKDSAETRTGTSPIEEKHVESYPVQIDQVFDILKNRRRRAVLRYLQTVEDETTLGTLAEEIAALECEKDVSQITSSERKRVYVALYQCHLSKMDAVGAVSYNKPRGKIQSGEHSTLFEHYLPGETDEQPRWPNYYWLLPVIAGLVTFLFVLI